MGATPTSRRTVLRRAGIVAGGFALVGGVSSTGNADESPTVTNFDVVPGSMSTRIDTIPATYDVDPDASATLAVGLAAFGAGIATEEKRQQLTRTEDGDGRYLSLFEPIAGKLESVFDPLPFENSTHGIVLVDVGTASLEVFGRDTVTITDGSEGRDAV